MDHQFAVSITLPITRKETIDLLEGRRRVYRKVDPLGDGTLEAQLGCHRCGRSANDALNNPICFGPQIEPETETETVSDGAVEAG